MCPLLIMVGRDDAFGGADSATRLAESYRRRAGLTDVQLEIFDGARHEIFNELDRDVVIGLLLEWMEHKVLA